MNFWKEIIPIFLIASIPQNFFFTWFSFVFLGQEYRIKNPKRRILLFSIVLAIYSDILFLVIPTHWQILYSLCGVTFILFIFFSSFNWLELLKICTFIFIILLSMDTIAEIISINFVTREELLHNPISIIEFTWPSLILLWISITTMKRISKYPGVWLFNYLQFRSNKGMFSLFLFVFFQLLIISLLGAIILVQAQFKSLVTLFILLFIATILCFIIFFVALRIISQTKNDAVKMTQQLYIEDIDHMFTSIRGQRHDFLNHVQLMLAFLKQQKTSEAERYMQELVGEISEMNEIVRIDHPALAAFVQTKVAEAINKKIRFTHEILSVDSLSLGFKSIDIVKIIGNLVNNAFDEVMQLAPEERWVELMLGKDESGITIAVRNPGKLLSDDDIQKVFTPGYSTKNDISHSGLGLSIVKERVQSYKGKIIVESDPVRGTTFKIHIPS